MAVDFPACQSRDWPAIISLVNSMTGVSLLAMPYCFQKCGIILGAVMLFGCAQLTYSSCYSLIKSGYLTRSSSLEQLGLRCYDRIGKLVVETSIIGVLLASMVVNLVAVVDLTPLILSAVLPDVAGVHGGHYGRMAQHVVALCLALGLALPLSLRRSLDGVAAISAVAVLFYLAVVLQVTLLGCHKLSEGPAFAQVSWWRMEHVPECAPIFALAYSCQAQVFLLYNTLAEPSLEKMKGVLRSGIGVCLAEYMLTGVLGCAAFSMQTLDGNLLTAIPVSYFGTFVQFGFVASAILSFPIMVVPCRESLDSLCCPSDQPDGDQHADSIMDAYVLPKPMSSRRVRLWTVVIVLTALAAAILFPNVQSALSLVGATLGCLMSFVLPPLLFLKATLKSSVKYVDRLGAKVILFIGVLLLLVGTGDIIVSAAAIQEQSLFSLSAVDVG